MHDINQTAFNERRELVGSVDMRLKSSHEALRQIQTNAKDLRGSAHAEFMASLDTVKAREVDLHAAVKASQEADAGNWEIRRAAVARADRDYADAVAHLQALAPPVPRLP